MHHALAFLLLLAGAAPKPLNGYAELVVRTIVVEKGCDFSTEQTDLLHRSIVAHLRAKKAFVVIDCSTTEGAEAAKLPPADNVRRMIVEAEVIAFDAGSHTARAMGIGAGATKLRVRFTFKDSVTGKEILTFDRLGKYTGRFNGDGATNEGAFTASANEVVDGFVQELEKNR